MKYFLISFLGCLISLIADESRPNIILFLVDDMGLMDTSAPMLTDENGKAKPYPLNHWYRTPNMERLAKQGVRFSQFYSHNVCSPTRLSIMNGQNSARHHCTDYINPWKNNLQINAFNAKGPKAWNWEGLKKTDVTLPKILKESGYKTIHVGKAHFAPFNREGEEPLNLGFDVNVAGSAIGAPGSYYGKDSYGVGSKNPLCRPVTGLKKYHGTDTFLTEALTLEAKLEMDKAIKKDQPFFLHMSHYAVHCPFHSDPRFLANYKDSNKDRAYQAYATMIEGMDKSLGDLLDHLENKNVAEKTVVFFLGDNGGDAPTKNHDAIEASAPFRGRKGGKWEGGMRVPFIASWAKLNPNQVHQSNASIIPNTFRQEVGSCFDLFPTIAKFAKADLPKGHIVDGLDLSPLLAGQAVPDHNNQFLNHYPHPRRGKSHFFTTWRNGDWKVIYQYLEKGAKRYALYNLKEDPSESVELSKTKPDILKSMMQGMIEELQSMHAIYPNEGGVELRPEMP